MEARVFRGQPYNTKPRSQALFCLFQFMCLCVVFFGGCTCASPSGVELRGQLAEVDSLLPPVDSRGLPQAARLDVESTFLRLSQGCPRP